MIYTLAPQGVYRSIQGEGALLGTPMVFVRLAGCSIGCPQCDTDYRVHSRASADEIAKRAQAVGDGIAWAWVTGGEPTDRDLGPLLTALRHAGFKAALATAGVRPIALGWDWLSVSPHASGWPSIDAGHEIKLVFGLNGLSPEDCDPSHYKGYRHRFANDPEWVYRHRGWRLNVQAHKVWDLP